MFLSSEYNGFINNLLKMLVLNTFLLREIGDVTFAVKT